MWTAVLAAVACNGQWQDLEVGHKCASGKGVSKCSDPVNVGARKNTVLSQLLSFTAVSVKGIEYGPKSTTNYEPAYRFFDKNPNLVGFLDDAMLQNLAADTFPGTAFEQAIRSGGKIPLGKGIYMSFQDVMPFVTVYVHLAKGTLGQKDTSLKFRYELNEGLNVREMPECKGTKTWQLVIQKTKKETVRQVVASDHFYDCEEGFTETVRKLVADMVPDDSQFKDREDKAGDKRMRDEFKRQLVEAKEEMERQGMSFATIPLPMNAYFYIVGKLCPKTSVKNDEVCTKLAAAFSEGSGQGVVPFFRPLDPSLEGEMLV